MKGIRILMIWFVLLSGLITEEVNAQRFVDNKDGTFTDKKTGLMWHAQPPLYDKLESWQDAVNYCKRLRYAGYADWYLPNIEQWRKAIDKNQQNPALPLDQPRSRFGSLAWSRPFWSSSGSGSGDVLAIDLRFGREVLLNKTGKGEAWPVRSVKEQLFIDNGDGTVTDSSAGLMWKKEPTFFEITWEKAKAYCQKLEYAGYKNWVLPTIEELARIMDRTQRTPALPSGHPSVRYFLNPYTKVWSITPFSFSSSFGGNKRRVMLMYDGTQNYLSEEGDRAVVWPVRIAR